MRISEVFALFPVGKKVRVPPRVRVRSCPGRSVDSGGFGRDHRFRRVGAVLPEGQTILLEPTLPRNLLDPT